MNPDALMAALGYLSREWGSHGYRIERTEPYGWLGATLHVCHADGSRFTITADTWGNIVREGESL